MKFSLLLIICLFSLQISPENNLLKCSYKSPCVLPQGFNKVCLDVEKSLFTPFLTYRLRVDPFDYKNGKFKFTSVDSNGYTPLIITLKDKFLQFISKIKSHEYTYHLSDENLCFEFESNKPVQIWVRQKLEPIYILQICLALLFCTYSTELVSSDWFLVGIGFIFGVLLAIVLTLYMAQRTFRRNLYSSLFFGYLLTAFPIFFAHLLNKYLNSDYNLTFIIFLVCSGIFGACGAYIYGPIQNYRAKRVMSLGIVVLGCVLHFASQSLAFIASSLCLNAMLLIFKLCDINKTYSLLRNAILCKKKKSAENTRESLTKLRLECLNAGPELRAKIGRLKNRESFVRFLRTGEDCVVDQDEITEASLHNIPAYELLTSDQSE